MNRLIVTIIFLLFATVGFGRHLKGGFFTYKYISKTGSTITYSVTLTVYMECNATGMQVDETVNFTFFDAGTNTQVRNVPVNLTRQYQLGKTSDEQCITGDQRVCYYKIVIYELGSVELPINDKGYTIAYQRCCRIDGINNLVGSGQIGNTYAITIPGTTVALGAEMNNSAQFHVNDTIVICGNSQFEYPFVATDPDNHTLKYSFCDAWTGGSVNTPAPTTATKPPFSNVPYANGFDGSQPLGPKVSIDPNTGLIKGIAPQAPGEYVVTVCVEEYDGTTLIATTRKELHVKVGDCAPISADLNPSYITCDGYTLTFQNNSTSPEIKTYYWDLGVAGTDNDISTQAINTYTFPDTGTYTVKLVVNRGLACTDSTTTTAKVYPGFFPDFDFAGVCVNKPTRFTDKTSTVYGFVDSWSWDFGNTSSNTDTSTRKDPTYTYTNMSMYSVRLIATNSKGCRDTVIKQVTIIDRPPLSVRFKDTLICNGDPLQLEAIGNGVFSWTPAVNMINENTATPTVAPFSTTKYFVQLDDNGCLNQDSVNVRVVDFVSLKARGDTLICANDTIQLNAVSDGLRFAWSPANMVNNPAIINPKVAPGATTTFTVTAYIGGCTPATDDVTVTVVPYPGANAGQDTVICFGTTAQLNGSIVGTSFSWSPVATLQGATTLSPIAKPINTTAYVLTSRDALSGCPKPNYDTVLVTVLPKIKAFAGRDTSVVVNQPLQFGASGGIDYQWTPTTSLSNPNIANPTGLYNGSFDSIRYKVNVYNEAGCVDSAYVSVRIFKTIPQVFVPTAFTPNRDGRNDYFRPIAVGIKRMEYFRVYNRWGELVFQSVDNESGWDGRIKGKEQGTATYVWLVKGVDYLDKPFFAKGTVTLIR